MEHLAAPNNDADLGFLVAGDEDRGAVEAAISPVGSMGMVYIYRKV